MRQTRKPLLKTHFECHLREMMRGKLKRKTLLGVFLAPVLACAMPASAQTQDRGYWRAADSAAQTFTGDVVLAGEKITINYSHFPMAQIRTLAPGELRAVFDVDNAAGGSGSLYRMSIPSEKKFLHHNTLCGGEDTQWMASYVTGNSLRLAFFSGGQMPVFTPEAMANATNLCGTFSYVR